MLCQMVIGRGCKPQDCLIHNSKNTVANLGSSPTVACPVWRSWLYQHCAQTLDAVLAILLSWRKRFQGRSGTLSHPKGFSWSKGGQDRLPPLRSCGATSNPKSSRRWVFFSRLFVHSQTCRIHLRINNYIFPQNFLKVVSKDLEFARHGLSGVLRPLFINILLSFRSLVTLRSLVTIHATVCVVPGQSDPSQLVHENRGDMTK